MLKSLKNWYYKYGVVTVFDDEEKRGIMDIIDRYGAKVKSQKSIMYKLCYKWIVPNLYKDLGETIVFRAKNAEIAMKILKEFNGDYIYDIREFVLR